jgi:hypothetical protein
MRFKVLIFALYITKYLNLKLVYSLKIMNKMTGIILIVVGAILLVSGIVIFFNSRPSSSSVASDATTNNSTFPSPSNHYDTREQVTQSDSFSNEGWEASTVTSSSRNSPKTTKPLETENLTEPIKENEEEENKRKGDEFEKYVVQKFNQEYFKVKEWSSDKYVNGIYAETTLQPDIILEFQLRKGRKQLAIECKWRKGLYENSVDVLNRSQISRYRKFEKEKGIPVFIVVGLGGNPSSPKDLFVLPLRELDNNIVYINTLKKFRKDKSENFYFDLETVELR